MEETGLPPMARSRRLSVGAYLLAAFVLCGIAVSALIGTATYVSFERERDRADHDLLAAARSAADEQVLGIAEGLPPVIDGLAASPDIASFDPALCRSTMEGLAGGISDARLHVFNADGELVCSFDDPELGPVDQPTGPWFETVQETGEPVWVDIAEDPFSDHTALLYATPAIGPDGRVGAMLAVVYGGGPILTRVAGAPDDTVVLLLDAKRELVLATTPEAFEVEGPVSGTLDYARLRAGDTASIVDDDGTEWLFAQVEVDELGWHAVAGRRMSDALAPARSLLRTMALIGAALLASLGVLAVVLRRRLAHPLRRLEAVARKSAAGDDDVRAATAGPTELAALATRFNALLDERQAREEDLRWRALHDVLTGLPNRAALAERLTEILEEGRLRSSVLFVDLDRFKLVNDTHGHPTGDRLLVDLSARLRDRVEEEYVLGRFGGDEFVLVCPGLDVKAAIPLATRIIEAVREPIELDGLRLYVSACVGIASARAGQLADEIVSNADIAMYEAKARGTGSIQVFDEALRARTSSRAHLEHDLHRALDDEQLVLHYQPIVDLDDGSVVGVEALMRWDHPRRGLVAPDTFIPIANDSGLLVDMGGWAIETAAQAAAQWTSELGRPFPVSVNVAAAQLAYGDLPERVARAIDRAGIQPDLLHLEVTESGLLEDPDLAATMLGLVREIGVPVSLDDFGTGYSSLSYLQMLPLDTLKVDRTFVSRLDLGTTSSRIVRSVVDLAEALGLDVIAEGVETGRQLEILRRLGCHQAQGYLFARPVPAAELRPLASTQLLDPGRPVDDRGRTFV